MAAFGYACGVGGAFGAAGVWEAEAGMRFWRGTFVWQTSAFPMGGREGAARQGRAGVSNGGLARSVSWHTVGGVRRQIKAHIGHLITSTIVIFFAALPSSTLSDPQKNDPDNVISIAIQGWVCAAYFGWLSDGVKERDILFDSALSVLRRASFEELSDSLANDFRGYYWSLSTRYTFSPSRDFRLGVLWTELNASLRDAAPSTMEQQELWALKKLRQNNCIEQLRH